VVWADLKGNRLQRLGFLPGCHLESLNVNDNLLERLDVLPPSLRVLHINSNPQLRHLPAHHSLSHLSALQSQLETVVLGPQMREANLSFNAKLTGVEQLPEALEILQVAYCPKLQLQISAAIANLHQLSVARSPGVQVAPLCFVSPNLTALNLSYYPHKLVLPALPSVTSLLLTGVQQGQLAVSEPWDSLREYQYDTIAHPSLNNFHLLPSLPQLHPLPPVTTYAVASAVRLGPRPSLEDAWGVVEVNDQTIWCLCDGHGGDSAAQFVCQYLLEALRHSPLEEALFDRCDEALHVHLARPELSKQKTCGTTVLVVAVGPQEVQVANVGDSRAIRIFPSKVQRLSHDHTPQDESLSLRKRGGWIEQGRVNGVLGVGRVLGDHYLRPIVSRKPTISVYPPLNDHTIVLGCDGLFDELSDEMVTQLGRSADLQEAAQTLVDCALARGSQDNISVILIRKK
jgi:serine/threonine protein phosphatase PrpC